MQQAMVLKYNFMSSLKHKALIHIAINIWNKNDIWSSASEFILPILDNIKKQMPRSNIFKKDASIDIIRNEKWALVEQKVIDRIRTLSLPEVLKEDLFLISQTIAYEILRWKVHFYCYYDLHIDLPCEFCWTPQGTVDQKKTAELLIKGDILDIIMRYHLACVCCLEGDIKAIWNKMDENDREEKQNSAHQCHLVTYWTRAMGDVSKEKIECQLVRKAAKTGNEVAVKYFLQRLTPEEREKSIVSIAQALLRSFPSRPPYIYHRHHANADAVYFLISQMDEEQQKELFESQPYEVLRTFLEWPYQSLFMEIAKHISAFTHKNDEWLLLREIVQKRIDNFTDYNYQKLFSDFWQLSVASKRFDIDMWSDHVLPAKLLEADDRKNIRLILSSATLADKEKLIFSYIGKEICNDLIIKGHLGLLEFFVGECISSKDVIIQFREEFKRWIRILTGCVSTKKSLRVIDQRLNIFLKIIDDLIKNHDKENNLRRK